MILFFYFLFFFFFFNDTATTEIYTLSLHDALPILSLSMKIKNCIRFIHEIGYIYINSLKLGIANLYCFSYTNKRSEEHTSELQSQSNLVCRLLLEKKKKKKKKN